jgi:hypothetical protein
MYTHFDMINILKSVYIFWATLYICICWCNNITKKVMCWTEVCICMTYNFNLHAPYAFMASKATLPSTFNSSLTDGQTQTHADTHGAH